MGLTIACAKGYLLKEAVPLFDALGITFDEPLLETRKLSSTSIDGSVTILQIRPWDVPVYVENGCADLGIVGYDVLHEHHSQLNRLLDLKFGGCKLVIAGKSSLNNYKSLPRLRVATKYPHSTELFFRSMGIKVELIKLYGAIELAPITGLSDVICDLTATGLTLKENNLTILDSVLSSTANLVGNPLAMKTRYHDIIDFVDRFKHLIHA